MAPDNTTALLEVRITGSVSGENRGAIRMTLTGKKLKGSKAMLTLQNIQKAPDAVASDGANSVNDKLGK